MLKWVMTRNFFPFFLLMNLDHFHRALNINLKGKKGTGFQSRTDGLEEKAAAQREAVL